MTQENNTNELMMFLTNFKTSIEEKILNSTEKLDGRMTEMTKDIRNLNDKVTANEKESAEANDAIKRMDIHLDKLEKQMERSVTLRQNRSELKEKERILINTDSEPVLNLKPGGSNLPRKQVDNKPNDKDTTKNTSAIKQVNRPPPDNNEFRSSWARQVQAEIEDNAAKLDEISRQRKIDREEAIANDKLENNDNDNNDDIRWEVLEPAIKKMKVRKPVNVKHFFGDESERDTSTDESDNDEWKEVDDIKKNKLKKIKQREKRKRKQAETAMKARAMLGIGPVTKEIIQFHENKEVNKDIARLNAAEDFLSYHLDFNRKELDSLDIRETKEGKDNVIYIAVANPDMIREIHYRKAESRNDELIARNYVPPQFYARYMYINKMCSEERSKNSSLKTQMRFGPKDIEVYTKLKGQDKPFRKVELEVFVDMKELPNFDHKLSWKTNENRPPRRTLQFPKPKQDHRNITEEPATEKNNIKKPTLHRQRSTQEDISAKKPKLNSTVADTSYEDMESDSSTHQDTSPASRKQINNQHDCSI